MSFLLQQHKPAQGGWRPRVLAAAKGTQAHWGECCIPQKLSVCVAEATKGMEVAADEPTSELHGGH